MNGCEWYVVQKNSYIFLAVINNLTVACGGGGGGGGGKSSGSSPTPEQPTNTAPVAIFTVSEGDSDLNIRFDGSASTGGSGNIVDMSGISVMGTLC